MAANTPVAAAGGKPSLVRLLRRRTAGIALAEIMIAVSILIAMAGISLFALSSDNNLAAVNRNLLAAKTVAQAQIDEAQSVTYTTTGTVPSVLATGTSTSTVTIAEGPPALTGTRTTTAAVTDATLGIRRVTVRVTYTYRGRPYSVTLATARAPD
jgi:type II secretory pathway pseudopilin PulG